MEKVHLIGFILIAITGCILKPETFEISGQVTDFNDHPLDSVSVFLKNKAFENMYESLTDSNGNYSMKVKKGDYYCLYAIKSSDYRVNKLEYWLWNVPVYHNLEINPQYDRIEIYGINVFEPQVTPQETYMIYFRPMSLTKTLELISKQKVSSNQFKEAVRTEALLDSNNIIINISPDNITKDELKIEINGKEVEIMEINKITEYARGFFMYGYLVQVLKPKDLNELELQYDRISITLHSSETGEIGKGKAFVKR